MTEYGYYKAKAENSYWQFLADLLGWQLQDWTSMISATYVTRNGSLLAINASQRDDIVRAIIHK